MRKRSRFRAAILSLEPRAVPSAGHPAAQVLSIHGSGRLLGGSESTVLGGVQTRVAIEGSFGALGATSGTLNTVIQTRSLRFNATAILNTADGDQLDLSFKGRNQKPQVGEIRAVGRFPFHVTGGTGALAGATGGGTITVVETLADGADTFTLRGLAHTRRES